ncbi:MAG: hypothetical protein DRI89_03860 [Bacteroidetes bacterium]|nr:MAG: hypothetical protein DRI89_03860 [Bacteroidota bacterium]
MKNSGVFSIIILLFFGFLGTTSAQNRLTGLVNYNDNDTLPIPEVKLGLYDMQDVLIMSTETDDDGRYSFDSIPGGEYHLRSFSDLEPNLVDIQDSYLVLMYLLNWIELDDIQYEAADINNSGTVTWYDYFYIVINYLLHGEPFPAGVWQFEEAYIDFTSRDAPPDTTDLWGVTEGDVDGWWEPSGRDVSILNYSHYAVHVETGEFQLQVKSTVSDQIAGFSINITYPVDQLRILDVVGPDKNLNYFLDEKNGIVKIIWMDENNSGRISADNLISLVVESKNSDFESAAFELLPGSMLIDAKGCEIENVEIQLPLLEMNQEFELQVSTYPNPVINELHVRLNLIETANATISIFDVSGKLMSENNNLSLEKGEHLIAIDTEKFKPGYYFYIVDLSGNTTYTAKGKIIKSR